MSKVTVSRLSQHAYAWLSREPALHWYVCVHKYDYQQRAESELLEALGHEPTESDYIDWLADALAEKVPERLQTIEPNSMVGDLAVVACADVQWRLLATWAWRDDVLFPPRVPSRH